MPRGPLGDTSLERAFGGIACEVICSFPMPGQEENVGFFQAYRRQILEIFPLHLKRSVYQI